MMPKFSPVLAILFLILANGTGAAELPALRIKGTKLVDEKGIVIQLRGVNFGCWLVPESHFLGQSFRDEKTLWNNLEPRFSKAKVHEIREAYRTAWIGEDDFHNVKKLGLNHVRVPFGSTLLESDANPDVYQNEGWDWLDNVVKWSETAGIYCILDLHGAPGGQSKAEHTGEKDRNELWTNANFQRRTRKLWQAIAKRYKGRKAIAAFDLLNEPMGATDSRTMLTFQFQLAQAIREVDSQRLVIVEDGYKGIDKFIPIAPKDKTNIIYSVHVYPTLNEKQPTPEHHERYFQDRVPKMLQEQTRFGQPLYIGEWNVIQEAAGGSGMIAKHVAAMEKAGWSWSMWIYKQANPNGVRGLWSIYRNTNKADHPNFEKDDADTILTKIANYRTEKFELYRPIAESLGGR
jgi:endoglucanase